MIIKKRYAVPALVLGVALLGGGTAFAATSGTFDASKLSGFTDAQKSAIEQAFTLRKNADIQAKAMLDAAGVDQQKLHDAMRGQHDAMHAKMDAALDANDFSAFQALVAGTPMADKATTETFAKLVEIRKLEKAGDKAGAQALRKELGFGKGPGGMMGGKGPMGNQGAHDADNDKDSK